MEPVADQHVPPVMFRLKVVADLDLSRREDA